MRTEADEARFEKWWSRHSMIFVLKEEGDQLDCVRPSDEAEVILAKAAARSAWGHCVLMAAFAPAGPFANSGITPYGGVR